MLDYILNSGFCLLIFFGFYKLILEREKNHHLKRFYLLAILLLSFGIPLITFTTYVEVAPQETITFSEEIMTFDPSNDITIPTFETDYTPIILWGLYLLGVILFSIQFVYNLASIYFRIKSNPKVKYDNFTQVLLHELVAPHTFFNYIFFNKTKFELEQIPKEVQLHEQAHANQKHSLDILFIEVLKIVFWFNPLIYFIKRSIKLNHEFLADQDVLNKGVATATYQQTLLSFTSYNTHTPLANAINYSSIKKRFTAMKSPTSKKNHWIKSSLILPLIALLLVAFSQKKTVEKETTPITKEIMGQLESQQVSTNKNNSSILRKKEPTSKQFESWKDQEKFALWLDDKPIKNSELNKYDISDIYFYSGGHYSGQFRKKEYPQTYYFKLFTKNGFNEYNHNASLMGYSTLLKIYNKRIEKHLKTNDDNDIEKLKNHLDEMYQTFSKEEKAKWGIKLALPVPSTKKKSQQKPPPLIPVQPESKNFENPNDVPPPATPQVNKGYVKVNKPKNLIQHDVKFTNKNGEVYNEKRTEYSEKDKQVIPPPPVPVQQESKKKMQQKPPPPAPVQQQTMKFKSPNDVPPPPASVNSDKGYIKINGEEHYYITENNNTKYWDRNGSEVDKDGNIIHSNLVKTPNKEVRLIKTWFITIDNVKYYYTFDKDERVARYYTSDGKLAKLDIVKEYKRKNATLKKLQSQGKHYVFKTAKERKEIDSHFSDLGGMYYRMDGATKNTVERPTNSIAPYVRLKDNNGEIYFKKRDELTEDELKSLPKRLPPPAPKKPVNTNNNQSSNTLKIIINKNGDYLMDGNYADLAGFTKKIIGFTTEEKKNLL